MCINLASSANPAVLEFLSRHPRIERVEAGDYSGVGFSQGEWSRAVWVGDPGMQLYGLVEVMDNNPLVCADQISVPGPAATMALIALAPLIHAGLVADAPVLMLNFGEGVDEIPHALESVGWIEGADVHIEEMDLGGVLAATAIVSIKTPDDLDDLDALYGEHFGRSFYIRRDESSEWGPAVASGKPYASYRLRVVPDEPNSLLTARILADREGKCGAAQIIHAMNVMCGFEESLGIS